MLLALGPRTGFTETPVLEVFELRHRPPEELLPVVQDMLAPEGSASALGNKLIVKATPAQLHELRGLLRELDVAARQLLITVRQQRSDDLREREVELSGRIEAGDGEIVLPGERGAPRRPRLRVQDDSASGTRGDRQHIRVLEGYEANIYLGETRPYVLRQYLPDGRYVESTQLQDTLTGFVVRPRLQGERVLLEISPRQERAARAGRVERMETSTTVSGALGEWLDLSGAVEDIAQRRSGLFAGGNRAGRTEGRVLVKVELAD